jgi:hypothetical protein
MTHILTFIFVLSLLNLIRHGFIFYKRLVETTPQVYRMNIKEMIFLGVSISIIITLLICGFTI